MFVRNCNLCLPVRRLRVFSRCFRLEQKFEDQIINADESVSHSVSAVNGGMWNTTFKPHAHRLRI
jgi:hypothetical protein